MRILCNRSPGTDLNAIHKSAVNFFETEPFHQWSFACHEEKMPDKRVWSSYKLPLKQFIKDFTGDDEYYASKTKVISVNNGWGNQLAIDSNFQPVSFGAHSVSLLRMEQKYGASGLDRYLSKSGIAHKQVVHALAAGEFSR